MCDERERLIGYLYDECDASEKRAVEAHLETCETCREEVGGLRSVRTDLLSWDVPEHGSVWTPFVKARPAPWWQAVPAWATAAAAAAMLVAGAAGGAATQLWLRPGPSVSVQAPALPGIVAAPASVSQADLTAMEQRVMQAMRAELTQHVSLVSAHEATNRLSEDDMMRRVNALIRQSEQRQFQTVVGVSNDLVKVKRSTDAEIAELRASLSQPTVR